MSRIRSIHPGFWTDKDLVNLSIAARLFLIGLLNECDDRGSFDWAPTTLKMKIFPADQLDVVALLTELCDNARVVRYQVDGKSYGAVRNFCKWQRPKKPNQIYPQTGIIRVWADLASRTRRNGSEQVRNRFGTGSAMSRQRDEGRGDEEEDCSYEQSSAPMRAGSIEVPEWVPEKEWAAFKKMRRAKKRPFTSEAEAEILNDLARLRGEGHDPVRVLLNSVKFGWNGVFGDEKTRSVPSAPGKPLSIDERRNLVRFYRDQGDEIKALELEAAFSLTRNLKRPE